MKISTIVCRHFKFGYCKYKNTCRLHHVQEVCDSKSCDVESCNKRHPKVCRYWREYGRCKFSEFCSYRHVTSSCGNCHENEILEELRNKLVNIESKCSDYQTQLNIIESKLKELESGLLQKEEKVNDVGLNLNNLREVVHAISEATDLHKLRLEVFNEEFYAYSLIAYNLEENNRMHSIPSGPALLTMILPTPPPSVRKKGHP